ncbi:uncharacterized protein J4E78_003589 [Alternaria triticimaculans]|uniref:uncharacterized protein n=1 Tax=Alternaria triticimaculans TaxID=297637 RepID=UPI0020C34AF6|nr:uncharacterized protein J4E78_003589 [Alternaria triticimaculans]KAI4666122.1 hypothetical protein J4E78_003589 [Alternaria triticimaculans]
MSIVLSATIAIAFAAFAIIYATRWHLGRKNARPLPPGPKGLPILGNVNDMPKSGMLECHHWLRHKDIYGPLSSVTVLGQTFIIINDPEIAFELLRDRSAIHSSRPSQTFSGDITNVSVSVFDKAQETEAAHFLLNLLESPDKLFDHIRKEAGSVILKITYGYTAVANGNDPFVDMAAKTMEQFADATVPGKWSVDIFPFCTGFKDTARRMAAQLSQCTNQPYEFVKKQMREKRHSPSFLSQCIEGLGSDAEMEFVHKWTALALYLGGADTTVSSIMTFFLAMTVFPEVQKKAQEELDRVIGGGRLPVSKDRESLPYIEAIMKETHRWHLVAPMCLPHCSTEEDTCRGYRIPKGSILLPNNWHFTHDPEVYPEPMVFRPERFLETPTHKSEPDPRNFIFGYGRRICPGRYVADNALFITIAQTLAVFDITKSVDGDGRVVEPEVKFEPGAISHPVPYRCSIKPRSEDHKRLIKASEQLFPWEESDAKELENISW